MRSAEVLDRLVDRLEQGLDLLQLQRGEGDADVARPQRDHADALLEQVQALKRHGLTILLAEQGVEFSLALADRVYVLEKGAVVFSGPAAELRDDAALRERLLAL